MGDVGHRQNIPEGNFELGVILGSESPDMLETLKFMDEH